MICYKNIWSSVNSPMTTYMIRVEPTENKKSSLLYHRQRYDGYAKYIRLNNKKYAMYDSGLFKSNPQMYDREDKRAVLYHNKLETKKDII